MAFVEFQMTKGGNHALPKGVCSLSIAPKHGHVSISAPDALNGLRTHNYVRFFYDAASNKLGIKKSDNAKGAAKICRQEKTSVVNIAIPANLRHLLNEIGAKSGRYYFVDDPEHGFYTIDLGKAVVA